MLAIQGLTTRRPQSGVRCLSSLAVIFAVASGATAASNYRPLQGESYRPTGRGHEDRLDPLDRDLEMMPRRHGRIRNEDRPIKFDDDRDRFYDRLDRRDDRPGFYRGATPSAWPAHSINRGSDSFGLTAPRMRGERPWQGESFDRESLDEGVGYHRIAPHGGRLPFSSHSTPPQKNERPQSQADDRPDPQELITRRYQDPAVLRFIGSVTPDRVLAMYSESLKLIESRHLNPPPPQALVARGVSNLIQALQNPAFVEANRLDAGAQQAQAFEQMLMGQLQQIPIRTTEEATTALETAMRISAEQLQLSPVVVGIEFEYGAIESLDRFSAFVPPETARAASQQLGDAMVGIGVQIEADDEGVRIRKVIADSPAEQAGLQKGDLIVAVDDQRLAGGNLESASSLLAGPAGAAVRLTVARAGAPLAEVSLSRRNVALRSVTDVQMLDPAEGVAYMKLESFATNSAREMEQALWSLQQQGMKSLVLDLRGDPGGLLTTAIEVADLFLPEGTIVSTRGRTQSDNTTESASRSQTWKVPLILVVDENSASASEILAAAIQENGRGTIVGRRTYGKGTVQTLFPLQSVSGGLRLTTAKFYSPTGREMAGAGVEPDVPVPLEARGDKGDQRTDRDLQTAIQVAIDRESGR